MNDRKISFIIKILVAFNLLPRLPATKKSGDDPCNPLYWYPRLIPEYCYYKKGFNLKPPPSEDPLPIPMPIPVPIPPIPVPMPVPMPQPILPPFIPQPYSYPLPFGIPLAPTNPMLPVAGIPLSPQPIYPSQSMYPSQPICASHTPHDFSGHHASPFANYVPPFGIQRRPMSMVPGLPGLVAPDGGINILPFSDAYADLLEKHKQKMIRKRLQKLLDEYDGFRSKKFYRA